MRRRTAILSIPLAVAASVGVIGLAGSASAEHTAATVLTGNREVPGPGDPNGRGRAFVTVNLDNNSVCLSVRHRNIDAPTAAHIHEGATTEAGPVVVDYSAFIGVPGSSQIKGCVVVDSDLANDIYANEGDFYVNVHNPAYPDGAIRGQLGGQ